MAILLVNGYRANVRQAGVGSPVLLVHGLAGNARATWSGLCGELARSFHVIAYDARGAGESEVTPGDYDMETLTDDLIAVIRELGLGPTLVVGHSMGATLALLAATAAPDDVSAVVAAAMSFGARGIEERTALADLAAAAESTGMADLAPTLATMGTSDSFRQSNPSAYRALAAAIADQQPAGFAARCRALSRFQLEDQLEALVAPVVLIAGDADPLSAPSANRLLAQRLQRATLVELAGCGHEMTLEQPDALLDAIHQCARTG